MIPGLGIICTRLPVNYSILCFKRACFSQGSITISKHCNQLKGDIVEALQCVKCSLCHDLLFCKPGPSSLGEDEFDADADADGEATENAQDDPEEEDSWDNLLLE
jgi:hypothetical protein